ACQLVSLSSWTVQTFFFHGMLRPPLSSTHLPYTTLFRSAFAPTATSAIENTVPEPDLADRHTSLSATPLPVPRTTPTSPTAAGGPGGHPNEGQLPVRLASRLVHAYTST